MDDRQRPALTFDQTLVRMRNLALRVEAQGGATQDDIEQMATVLLHWGALQGWTPEEMGPVHHEPFATILREQNQAPLWLHA